MKYCADTWFMLELFGKNKSAISVFEETRLGKARIIIPMIVFAETTKKLLQKGVSQQLITDFFDNVEASQKVELVVIERAIANEAAHLSLSYNVPMIDSLVAATCRLTGCDILLAHDSDYQLLVKRRYVKLKSW